MRKLPRAREIGRGRGGGGSVSEVCHDDTPRIKEITYLRISRITGCMLCVFVSDDS